MVSATLTFGKHAGEPLHSLPRSYLAWLLSSCDRLDTWTRRHVKAELEKRGERYLDAAAVLADLQDTLDRLVVEDRRLDHREAGLVGDILLDGIEEVARRHGIGEQTELTIPARRPPLCPACQGRIWGAGR